LQEWCLPLALRFVPRQVAAMWDGDFRTRQVLVDLVRVPGFGTIADPWAAAFDPDTGSADRWPSLAAVLHLVI